MRGRTGERIAEAAAKLGITLGERCTLAEFSAGLEAAHVAHTRELAAAETALASPLVYAGPDGQPRLSMFDSARRPS